MSHPTRKSLTLDSPWPHRVAVLVACATFPLIWVGGLVTTYDAGMAVPDWPSTYGYNLFLYPWQTWISGPWDLFIEHGHRLLGAAVGLLTLLLAAVVWRCDCRTWVRWFSLVCVAGVIGQGVLGGMRVLLDERVLAKIHGCTGPLFFCLVVAMAVVTSRKWRDGVPVGPAASQVAALAWLVTALAFLQILVGAQLRHITVNTSHTFFRIAVFFHIALAAALLIHTVYLALKVLRLRLSSQRWLAVSLVLLLMAQVLLGVASWVVKYGPPPIFGDWMVGYTVAAKTLTQSLIVTGHVATGSLILVTCLTVAMHTTRENWSGQSIVSRDVRDGTTTHHTNVTLSLEPIG